MARPKTDAREQLVAQLIDIFYEFGYDGTTLALITARTGYGRASLYHHFPGGKDEMARAVLEKSDEWSRVHLASLLESDEPPRERLAKYLQALDTVQYRARQLTPSNAFGVGEGLLRFGDSLLRRTWDYHAHLSRLLIECGISPERAARRVWEAKVLIEGALVCSRLLDDMTLFRNVMRHLDERLLAEDDTLAFLTAHPGSRLTHSG